MKKKTLLSAGAVALMLAAAPAASYARIAGGTTTTSSTTTTTATPVSADESTPMTFNFSSDIDLVCSQTSTTVRMNFGIDGDSATADTYLKMAFTNPSVKWMTTTQAATAGLTTGAGWYKKSGKDGSWQTASGSDLTTLNVKTNPTASTHTKKDSVITGNPYVYYQNLTPRATAGKYDVAAGTKVQGGLHCNFGVGNASIPLDNWQMTSNLSNHGHVKTGSCMTSSKETSASLVHANKSLSVSGTDSALVLYSNKQIADADLDSGQVTLRSGSDFKIINLLNADGTINTDPADNDVNWKGYHVWFGAQTVEGATDPIDFSKIWDKSAIHGIGGNPSVWIGVGEDDSTVLPDPLSGASVQSVRPYSNANPFQFVARCNNI